MSTSGCLHFHLFVTFPFDYGISGHKILGDKAVAAVEGGPRMKAGWPVCSPPLRPEAAISTAPVILWFLSLVLSVSFVITSWWLCPRCGLCWRWGHSWSRKLGDQLLSFGKGLGLVWVLRSAVPAWVLFPTVPWLGAWQVTEDPRSPLCGTSDTSLYVCGDF